MKGKALKSTALLGLVSLLSGCYVVKALDYNVIAPIGATSLAYVTYASDRTRVEITNQTANVRAAFYSDTYDAIIFDTFTGLSLIQNSDLKFKLARVITIGNLFVVATGKDKNDTIDRSDNIAAFGQGLMPDKIFLNTHTNIVPKVYYNSAALAASGLCTGEYQGESLDYVVLAEPFIYNTLNDKSCATYGKAKVVEDVRETFREYSKASGEELRGFPQAGLFISERLENQETKVKNLLKTIDADITDLERNGGGVVTDTMMRYGAAESQLSRFGLDYSTLSALQKDGRTSINKLAYNSFPLDLDDFALRFSDSLGIVTPKASSYSKFYLSVEEK